MTERLRHFMAVLLLFKSSIIITFILYHSTKIFFTRRGFTQQYPIDLWLIATQLKFMKLHESIKKSPIAFEPVLGKELSDDWAATGELAELLMGIGGCSPYLNEILRQEQKWISDAVFAHDPLKKMVLGELGEDPGKTLRQAKRRVAGYLALAELSGAYSLTETTQYLTDFADKVVAAAFKSALSPYRASGKISSDDDMFIIAMGKMGARELNYSSDIDLIVMFDDRNMDQAQSAQLRQVLVRATRSAIKLLSEVTEHGYVFRTDLRLRPDPSVTPICLGMTSALEYYESLGRTWERAAYIKARFCAGNYEAGADFLKQMVPFVWRRYLDFSAIEEAHELRLKIRQKTGTQNVRSISGHDIKLGRGGIREIEFFTQTRQLISGGRDPELRETQTLNALGQLVSKDWVSEAHYVKLCDSYTYLRHTEHALQMIRDAQTQSIPTTPDDISRIAALCGQSLDFFCKETAGHLNAVHEIAESFFAPVINHTPEIKIVGQDQITQNWPSYPALRSDRATVLFEKLRPKVLTSLKSAPDPKEALIQFDSFLRGLPAGIQVFSLFASNPKLLDLLTDIVVIAPALAQYLGQNSGVLDIVLSGEFFAPWPEQTILQTQLSKLLTEASDYESGLDIVRIWKRELHFRIGVHLLQQIITPQVAILQYTRLAEAVLHCLFKFVRNNFEKKFGCIKNSKCTILAMGSLGAKNLNSVSDLDLILIFDADVNIKSDGIKALECRHYFSRLTQALITALTVPTRNGYLYKVDMRLRPSGRAGPVATSLSGFETYQINKAWTWEHLALTVARPITCDTKFSTKVEKIRQRVLADKANWSFIRKGLKNMRRRLAGSKPQKNLWDIKRGPGGLQDIELMAQGIALAQRCFEFDTVLQLRSGVNSTFVNPIQLDELIKTFNLFSHLRLLDGLMCGEGQHRSELGSAGRERLQRIVALDRDEDLEQALISSRLQCVKIIDLLFLNIKGLDNVD